MTIRMSISPEDGIKITTGPMKVRKDDPEKWLVRNFDAALFKLEGEMDPSMSYKPGHLCRIEACANQKYNVFVGSHLIGQLPEEAVAFADKVDSSPEYMVSMVGKVEGDEIFVYIAE